MTLPRPTPDSRPAPAAGLRKLAAAAVASVALLAASGAVYEQIGQARDSRRFPRLGRPVNAAGITFNLNCSGSARPTVILDSGLGAPALGWVKIQPRIAQFSRVCSFDRPGYGWSSPTSGPRTSLHIARELKALLDAAGERGPFILVGPSFAGFNIRVFAGLFPAEVAGLVFLDPSHEDQQARLDEILPGAREQRQQAKEAERRAMRRELLLAKLKVPLGIERLQSAWKREPPPPAFGLAADLVEELDYLERQLQTREAVFEESAAMLESGRQAKASGNLGDRPIVVVTGGRMSGVPEPVRHLWIDVLQAEQARLSTRGRQVILPDSGHLVQFERPDAVVDAVREVWSAVRSGP